MENLAELMFLTQETYDRLKAKQPVVENSIPHMTLEFTESDSDTVSDANLETWYKGVLAGYQGEENYTVKASSDLMFLRLRLGVKKGEIQTLALLVNGNTHYVVNPLGKLCQHIPKEDDKFSVHDNLLYQLL